MFFYSKYHANCNSYLIIETDTTTHTDLLALGISSIVTTWCSFARGISADGVIFLLDGAHIKIYNSDGSEASFCGNGFRMVGHYYFKRHLNEVRWTIEHLGKQYTFFNDTQNTIATPRPLVITNNDTSAIVNAGNSHLLVLLTGKKQLQSAKQLASATDCNVGYYHHVYANIYYLMTYERGIGWSYSCGSNAIALATYLHALNANHDDFVIFNQYGHLNVTIDAEKVNLAGPVHLVSEGYLTIPQGDLRECKG